MKAEAKDQARLLLAAAGAAAVVIVSIIGTMALAPWLYKYEIDWKWLRFGVVTIGFGAYCLKTYREAWRRPRFWAILCGVFVIHLFGVGHFYYSGAGLPLLIFGPVVALEWALLALGVHYFLGIAPQVRERQR